MVDELLTYYDQNKRYLPWRKNRDPYRIWISEIMCQQTRVDTVIPYFLHFMDVYPDILSLAEAEDDVLMKLWQGLGYYNRARNLKKAALLIVEKYNGKFPASFDEARALPGIGDYTASAILSMAYDLPYASVDGNFLRVFSRFYEDGNDIALERTKKDLTLKLQSLLPKRSGDFNQAVMDVGATICLPNEEPRCECCPLKAECLACRHKSYMQYPYSSKETKIKDCDYAVFLIRQDGKYVLRKRPENGLLAGLYEFPNVSGKMTDAKLNKKFRGCKIHAYPPKTHHFSHQTWHMVPYFIEAENYPLKEDEFWVSREDLIRTYSVPKAFNQFFEIIENCENAVHINQN